MGDVGEAYVENEKLIFGGIFDGLAYPGQESA